VAATATHRRRDFEPRVARELAAELERAVEGEVRFDAGSRALYAHDLSIYRQVPIGVVVPRTVDDVVATVAACREHDAPVLPRGGGTSLVGQCTNVAVVVDCSKHLNRILELDPARKLAVVEPGVICDQLRDAAKPFGLTFGPDPATHGWCTLGGMIGNNSCGVHSVLTELYGQGPRTSDQVEELDVLTYDGERLRVGATSEDELAAIVAGGGRRGELYFRLQDIRDRYGDLVRERFPDLPRRVSGYGIDELLPERGFNVARALSATEGTCAFVLGAAVRLVESPPSRALAVLAYPNHFLAADDVIDILEHRPIGLEGFDASATDTMEGLGLLHRERKLLPDGGAWLLVEFGGDDDDHAREQAEVLIARFRTRPNLTGASLFTDPGEQGAVWLVRESALGASRIPHRFETWPSFEDAAVHPSKLGAYLRDFAGLLGRHGYRCVYFGHYGQGCVHCRINFDLRTRDGLAIFKRFLDEASELVVSYGGSLSGEHGDGQAHAHHLETMFGRELVEGFREFKAAWDPANRMNPGKVVDADPVDANLRLGPDQPRRRVHTYFSFHEDGGSFGAAAERCFGMGRCRRTEGGTMCPSYMATREEMHSTRGRAHLLFELLRGEVIGRDGWREESVKEALDLCLACKGCKVDCPVQVDVATYKAEFLAHYYERRLRPPAAYALGLVQWWGRAGRRGRALANSLTQTPALADAAKGLAGLATERALPRFASETFRDWVRARGTRGSGPPVLLWPDTFTDLFHPAVGIAAVEVLEAAGFRVGVPGRWFCCGRPLYDFGMLKLARRQLRGVLDALKHDLAAGIPIVGLEPSCLAVFKDELPNLFPNDETARRLSAQTYLLVDFLEREAPDFAAGLTRRGSAVVHGHCHQKALLGMESEVRTLAGLGLDVELLDSGCCGLAGSFGYEADHYEVSMACGERVLFPAVRSADPETLVVADGYSCREQIAHGTGRRALHVAEVLRAALPASL
jgi:FAD/FMN-containing dehydrogenase/Fe-S oxidoreductase